MVRARQRVRAHRVVASDRLSRPPPGPEIRSARRPAPIGSSRAGPGCRSAASSHRDATHSPAIGEGAPSAGRRRPARRRRTGARARRAWNSRRGAIWVARSSALRQSEADTEGVEPLLAADRRVVGEVHRPRGRASDDRGEPAVLDGDPRRDQHAPAGPRRPATRRRRTSRRRRTRPRRRGHHACAGSRRRGSDDQGAARPLASRRPSPRFPGDRSAPERHDGSAPGVDDRPSRPADAPTRTAAAIALTPASRTTCPGSGRAPGSIRCRPSAGAFESWTITDLDRAGDRRRRRAAGASALAPGYLTGSGVGAGDGSVPEADVGWSAVGDRLGRRRRIRDRGRAGSGRGRRGRLRRGRGIGVWAWGRAAGVDRVPAWASGRPTRTDRATPSAR